MAVLNAISPSLEMGAYEGLWLTKASSISSLKKMVNEGSAWHSGLIPEEEAIKIFQEALSRLHQAGVTQFGTRIIGTIDYPAFLQTDHPVPFLYFQGFWDLMFHPRKVAVVGTRKITDQGKLRARKVARWLVDHDFVVVSGLARGVDTLAHETAIASKGRTIAVIGTPLSEAYPSENEALQKVIARDHLLVSHVPVLRYQRQSYKVNRYFFPERNHLISAISEATVIVEAGESSGTRTQAEAALKQGRQVLILENVFQRGLSWPERALERGAVRVKNEADLARELLKDASRIHVSED